MISFLFLSVTSKKKINENYNFSKEKNVKDLIFFPFLSVNYKSKRKFIILEYGISKCLLESNGGV